MTSKFVEQIDKLCADVHEWAKGKGWWDDKFGFPTETAETYEDTIVAVDSEGEPILLQELLDVINQRNEGEMIGLMHSELSEALEGLRHGNPPSEHIPEFNCMEEELADTVIRIADLCKAKGYRLGEAIEAKMAFNEGRPYKHGKKF